MANYPIVKDWDGRPAVLLSPTEAAAVLSSGGPWVSVDWAAVANSGRLVPAEKVAQVLADLPPLPEVLQSRSAQGANKGVNDATEPLGEQKKLFRPGGSVKPDGFAPPRADLERAAEHLAKDAARLTDAAKLSWASDMVRDGLKAIEISPASRLSQIAKRLEEQQRAISGFATSGGTGISPRSDVEDRLRLPELPPRPPNPIHDTNKHLHRIEGRFEQMLDVAARGAQIATDLQAHAAQLLVKFENAAKENSKAAARAIRIGLAAVIIAVAMPSLQIVYTEFWRVPADQAGAQAVINSIQSEITLLRQTQIEAANRISAALERSDQQMIEVLKEVARSLAMQPTAPTPEHRISE